MTLALVAFTAGGACAWHRLPDVPHPVSLVEPEVGRILIADDVAPSTLVCVPVSSPVVHVACVELGWLRWLIRAQRAL